MEITSPRALLNLFAKQGIYADQQDQLVIVAIDQGQVVATHFIKPNDEALWTSEEFLSTEIEECLSSLQNNLPIVAVSYCRNGELGRHILQVVHSQAQNQNCSVLDLIYVCQGFWRSQLCEDTDCCPDQGNPYPWSEFSAGTDVTAAKGSLKDSQGVAWNENEDDRLEIVTQIALLIDQNDREGITYEITHRQVNDALVIMRGSQEFAVSEAAHLVMVCHNIRSRDGLLRKAFEQPELRTTFCDYLSHLLTLTPETFIPAVATTLAGIAWLDGNHALTRSSLDTALQFNEDYSLARLLNTALSHGIPAKVWSDSLEAVSYQDCLKGAA